MLWDIDLIFGIWNYNDELQIKFSFCFHWIIWPNYCPWILEFYIVFKLLSPLNTTVLLDIWFDFWNVSVLLSRGWVYGLFQVEWSLAEKHLQLSKLKVTNFLISFKNVGPFFHWRTFAINILQWLLLLGPHDTFNSEQISMQVL
jgi:hypothetical protein